MLQIYFTQVLTQEKYPKHAEEADARDGILYAERSEGQGDEGKETAQREHVVATESVEHDFPTLPCGRKVNRQEDGNDENLCLPQCLQGNARHGSNDGQAGDHAEALVAYAPYTEPRADDDAYDHGPAGLAEKAFPTLKGQPDECAAQRNRDAVVRVTAKDAHQQHQQIPSVKVFLTDAVVL